MKAKILGCAFPGLNFSTVQLSKAEQTHIALRRTVTLVPSCHSALNAQRSVVKDGL